MKTVGLITEYNPFHKGHKFHIEMSRQLTGSDYVVVLMSGNYVQRGEPAFFDKYLRARIALEQGADLVLELPVLYATGSAELFASGSVSILDRLGMIDSICFGSENASVQELQTIAEILAEEPPAYQTSLKSHLKSGLSFPAARARAVLDYVGSNNEKINQILSSPNHILGIEYLKSLKKRKSSICPYTISRIHSGYHDTEECHRFYSASALRNVMDKALFYDSLSEISPCYKDFLKDYGPITPNDFSLILGEKLLNQTEDSLSGFLDISRDLARSILNKRNAFQDFDSFISLIKSKNLTYTRISRCLIHLLLGITNELAAMEKKCDGPSYVRVLGFRKSSQELLKKISPDISLLTKMTAYEPCLSTEFDQMLFHANLYGDHLYRMVLMNKYHTEIPGEFNRKFIVSQDEPRDKWT